MTTTPATGTMKPSLKRTLGQMQTGSPESKAQRVGETPVMTTTTTEARQWFANGQLPADIDREVINNALNARTAQIRGDKAVIAQTRLAFPIPNIDALLGNNESDYTSSDSVSDLEDDRDETGKPLQMDGFPNIVSRTSSVATLSSNNTMHGGIISALMSSHKRSLQRVSVKSESAPVLKTLDGFKHESSLPGPNETMSMVKPDDFLKQKMLAEANIEVKTVPSTQVESFFEPVTDATVDGYDMSLVQKIREEDVEGLRTLMKEGRSMQCSNRFGESVVHMACRRGSLTVLEFFVNEANVNVKVCCDSGRTPLHDACWTSTPNFGVVRLLLDRCPDLLYITDNRGFTPLNYARHSHWTSWCEFLDKYSVEKLTAEELWNGEESKVQVSVAAMTTVG